MEQQAEILTPRAARIALRTDRDPNKIADAIAIVFDDPEYNPEKDGYWIQKAVQKFDIEEHLASIIDEANTPEKVLPVLFGINEQLRHKLLNQEVQQSQLDKENAAHIQAAITGVIANATNPHVFVEAIRIIEALVYQGDAEQLKPVVQTAIHRAQNTPQAHEAATAIWQYINPKTIGAEHYQVITAFFDRCIHQLSGGPESSIAPDISPYSTKVEERQQAQRPKLNPHIQFIRLIHIIASLDEQQVAHFRTRLIEIFYVSDSAVLSQTILQAFEDTRDTQTVRHLIDTLLDSQHEGYVLPINIVKLVNQFGDTQQLAAVVKSIAISEPHVEHFLEGDKSKLPYYAYYVQVVLDHTARLQKDGIIKEAATDEITREEIEALEDNPDTERFMQELEGRASVTLVTTTEVPSVEQIDLSDIPQTHEFEMLRALVNCATAGASLSNVSLHHNLQAHKITWILEAYFKDDTTREHLVRLVQRAANRQVFAGQSETAKLFSVIETILRRSEKRNDVLA